VAYLPAGIVTLADANGCLDEILAEAKVARRA
jgi:hypothetical protein